MSQQCFNLLEIVERIEENLDGRDRRNFRLVNRTCDYAYRKSKRVRTQGETVVFDLGLSDDEENVPDGSVVQLNLGRWVYFRNDAQRQLAAISAKCTFVDVSVSCDQSVRADMPQLRAYPLQIRKLIYSSHCLPSIDVSAIHTSTLTMTSAPGEVTLASFVPVTRDLVLAPLSHLNVLELRDLQNFEWKENLDLPHLKTLRLTFGSKAKGLETATDISITRPASLTSVEFDIEGFHTGKVEEFFRKNLWPRKVTLRGTCEYLPTFPSPPFTYLPLLTDCEELRVLPDPVFRMDADGIEWEDSGVGNSVRGMQSLKYLQASCIRNFSENGLQHLSLIRVRDE